jgi:hypothetical protein
MEYKVFFAFAAIAFNLAAFIPYVASIIRRKTQPHLYTWLIWTVTTGTAAFAILHGGGGIGSAGPLLSLFTTGFICILCIRYGTKNIKLPDLITLCAAFLAVIVWWQLKNPLLALLIATTIDLIGYIPTFRKSFEEPWSETLVAWSIYVGAGLSTLLALEQYTLLTVTFSLTTNIANCILITMLLLRRRAVQRP